MPLITTRERTFKPCTEGQHEECAVYVLHSHYSGPMLFKERSECVCECHDGPNGNTTYGG